MSHTAEPIGEHVILTGIKDPPREGYEFAVLRGHRVADGRPVLVAVRWRMFYALAGDLEAGRRVPAFIDSDRVVPYSGEVIE